MHACDQSSIFSTGGKFRPDYGLLLELHALTLVARSYALLVPNIPLSSVTVATVVIIVGGPADIYQGGRRTDKMNSKHCDNKLV